MQQSKYKIFPCEYACYVASPLDQKLYNVAGLTPVLVGGAPTLAAGDPAMIGSGCLHHAAFIDMSGNVWVIGDNTSNISGTGTGGTSIPITKTPVSNAVQVVAYANSGDPGGLGYGVAVVTKDGRLTLMGNTQSGFRGDGTEGNQSEIGPYMVNALTKPIKKVAIGSFCYALFSDGTVASWGGTRLAYEPTYTLGRGVDNPDTTRPAPVVLPEPIVDLVGGGEFTYFIGQSGAIYGVAYNPRYLGLGPNVPGENTPFNLTKTLNLPATPVQLAVGPQATYALLPNGDVYAWGDNTQAAIGNGQEGTFANYTAPWPGPSSWFLPQDTPIKINPPGVSFVRIFAGIGDAFYVYYEDSNANLWNNGRNKGYVLWNGKGGTPAQQSAEPNLWDVLWVTKIPGFGTIPTTPPVIAPRTVINLTVLVFGQPVAVPLADAKFTYSDGTTQ